MLSAIIGGIGIPLASWLVGRWISEDRRRRDQAARALAITGEAIAAAEAIGIARSLPGTGKYLEAVRLLSDGIAAELGRPATARELSALRAAAERRAWVAKLPAERRAAMGAP